MSTGEQEQPQPQPRSLDEYAAGLNQVNLDLQRQTHTYQYLRQAIANLQQVSALPPTDQLTSEQRAELPRLPTLMLRIPPVDSKQQTPDVVELDLNTVTRAEQAAVVPIFQGFADTTAAKLLQDWESVHNINGAAQHIVQNARQQMAQTGQPAAQQPQGPAPGPPAQPGPQMGLPPQGQAGG